MSRNFFVLGRAEDRKRAHEYVEIAPPGTRVEFRTAKRSLPQNDRLWLLLGAVSKQVIWHGQTYTDAEWKDFFMHAYRGEKWMPAEDGGMIPIGRSTSQLGKDEFGEFMALIEAFCARHDVGLPWENLPVIGSAA